MCECVCVCACVSSCVHLKDGVMFALEPLRLSHQQIVPLLVLLEQGRDGVTGGGQVQPVEMVTPGVGEEWL
jgi:hypothetical protein